MLIILFLVSHSNFLFVPCGRLSWLPVRFLLHVKYSLSYRIVLPVIAVVRAMCGRPRVHEYTTRLLALGNAAIFSEPVFYNGLPKYST